MKKTLALILAVIMVFALCACGETAVPAAPTAAPAQDTPPADAPKADKDIVVAALMNNLADTNTSINAKGIEDKGAELGITVKINDGRNDLSTQISQAEDMIAQGVDAIILHAISAEGSSVIVDMCNEASIPCVVMNLSVESEDYSAYVGVYDVYAGEMMGNRISELLGGKGKIVILEGELGQGPTILRDEGLDNTILKEPGIELLERKTANWSRDTAMSITEDLLTSHSDIDAILCHNDDMAMGALLACEAAGRKADIIVCGVDAIADAMEAVKEGRLDFTIFQDANGIGAGSCEVAYKLAKGESVEKTNYVDFTLITVDNVEQYIGINE